MSSAAWRPERQRCQHRLPVTSLSTSAGVPCTTGPGLSASVVPCTTKGAVPADIIAAFLYWQTTETTPTTPTRDYRHLRRYPSNPNASTVQSQLCERPMVGAPLGSPQIPACSRRWHTKRESYVRVYRADVLPYLPINSTANVRPANYTQTIHALAVIPTAHISSARPWWWSIVL